MAQSNWEADKMYGCLWKIFLSMIFFAIVDVFLSTVVCHMVCCSNLRILFRLDVYIYDYLLKRNLHTTAKAFMAEGKVAADPVGNEVL